METIEEFTSVFTSDSVAPKDPSMVMRQATENGKIFDPNVNAFIDKPDNFGVWILLEPLEKKGLR